MGGVKEEPKKRESAAQQAAAVMGARHARSSGTAACGPRSDSTAVNKSLSLLTVTDLTDSH